MHRRDVLKGGLALPLVAGGLGSLPSAMAQAQWPARNVTIIVPFPPGGQADLAARPIAEALKNQLGQPFIVENRSGAGAPPIMLKVPLGTQILAEDGETVIAEYL